MCTKVSFRWFTRKRVGSSFYIRSTKNSPACGLNGCRTIIFTLNIYCFTITLLTSTEKLLIRAGFELAPSGNTGPPLYQLRY